MKKNAKFEVFERKSHTPKWLPSFLRKTVWYWRLVAPNGEIIAVGSEPFASYDNVTRAVETVQKYAAKADLAY